ncbi:MAG: magnesium transporter, partial [Brevefilum sp.]
REAAALISPLLPPDQAEIFEDLSLEEQTHLLEMVAASQAANILEELDDDDAASLAESLDMDMLARVLDEMEPDEAADLLGDLSPELRRQSLKHITDSAEIQSLLRYADDTAGGLMTSEYYVFPAETPVGEIFNHIRAQPIQDEEIPYIYAVDEQGQLAGIARLADLIRAHPELPLLGIIDTQFVSIEAKEDQETAAQLLNRYDLLALPVLDSAGRLLGVITVDDAIAALEEEATEDIYKSAGIMATRDNQSVKSDLMVRGPVWRSWIVRIPFLLLTMVGGLLAGGVIGVFEEALETVVVLAFFIPVVMNMGGNSGTQSVGIFIRGQVLGQIDLNDFGKHLLREIGVGLGLGVILGLIAGAVATFWQGDLSIGLVVGLAIVCTTVLSTALGFLVPLTINKLGIDPAVASEPVITTINDFTGMLIYFLFASLFISTLR